jgi:hypothetical protein
MRTLPFKCDSEQIRKLVIEWWELLAAGKYQEAFDMFAHDDWEIPWSPEKLEEAIATYGFSSVPLKQHESTMTARLRLKRLGEDQLTLESVDIHVM